MKSFQEDYQLSFHTRWIHQVNKHICGGCQNEFQHSADFSDHLLSNQCKSKDKNLTKHLEEIQKKAISDSLVSYHLKNRYVCHCLKAFSNKTTFRNHVKSDPKCSLKERKRRQKNPDPDQVLVKKPRENDGNVIKQEVNKVLPILTLKNEGQERKLFTQDSSTAIEKESPDDTLQNTIQIDQSFTIEFEMKEETPDCDW